MSSSDVPFYIKRAIMIVISHDFIFLREGDLICIQEIAKYSVLCHGHLIDLWRF
jgi:hypothetical protein